MDPAIRIHDPGWIPEQKPAALTVSQVFDWFVANDVRGNKSIKADRERQRLRAMFAAKHGHRTYVELKPFDLLGFINEHGRDHEIWTRRRWKAAIERPFNYATECGLIDRNPVRGLKLGKGKEGRDWTDDEYRTLMRVAGPCFRRVLVFWRFSGLRPGELRTLQWSMVRKEIGEMTWGRHKTSHVVDKPRRVPFNTTMLKLLAWLKRNNPKGSRYVFLNNAGRPWTIQALVNHMDMLRNRADLSPEVRCHGGRHTFATNAVINGTDLATLAKLLGHQSVATTQRYVHLADKAQHLTDAMERAVTRKKRH